MHTRRWAPVRSLSTTAALLITGALALALIVFVFIGGQRRKDSAPHCVSAQALDGVKAELFRRAAALRGANDPAFAQVSGYSIVRAASSIARKHHGSARVSCSGTIALDLPPGVAVVGGRRTLTSNVTYDLAPGSSGAVQLAMLSKADDIVIPLAAVLHTAPVSPPLGAAPAPAPRAEPAAPADVGQAPAARRVERPKLQPVPAQRPEAVPPRKPAAPAQHPAPPPQRKLPAPANVAPSAPAPATTVPRIGLVRPSFNCRYARKQSEIAVCSNPQLASLDRQMAAQFFSALGAARPGQRAMLQRSRNRFLAFRDACGSEACIADAYRGRMREISEIMNGNW